MVVYDRPAKIGNKNISALCTGDKAFCCSEVLPVCLNITREPKP